MTDSHLNPNESDEQGRKVGMGGSDPHGGVRVRCRKQAPLRRRVGAIRGYVRTGASSTDPGVHADDLATRLEPHRRGVGDILSALVVHVVPDAPGALATA